MIEIDFKELKLWQKVVCIVLFFLIGWGSLYISDVYFSTWPSKIKGFLFVIGWVSCSAGIVKPISFLFNYLNKKEK